VCLGKQNTPELHPQPFKLSHSLMEIMLLFNNNSPVSLGHRFLSLYLGPCIPKRWANVSFCAHVHMFGGDGAMQIVFYSFHADTYEL
jgi:hypothetical protein